MDAVTNASGTLTSQQRYLPFGQERTDAGSIGQTDYGYTGQRDNSYIKLIDLNFRWMDPLLGRFVSPDDIVPNPANPQAWNRYSYVADRPIILNDPTGHDYCDFINNLNSEDCKGGLARVASRRHKIDVDVFPLPSAIKSALESQGADPNLLDKVVINRDKSNLFWKLSCPGGSDQTYLAQTNFNTIYWCSPGDFNTEMATPVLLHELTHVAQWAKYPLDVLVEIARTWMFSVRDFAGGKVNKDWQPYDPYKSSWTEVEGSRCQAAYQKDENIRLDMPPCNIWITLP